MEQIIDLPGPSIARDTSEVVSSSPDAAYAASAPGIEYLAPIIECGSSSSSAAHAAPEQAPSKRRRRTQYASLPGVLQDAVFLAPDARGHLYDTPDSERVMVWTVYEMASFGRGIPDLSWVPAGRAWRAHIYSERSISPCTLSLPPHRGRRHTFTSARICTSMSCSHGGTTNFQGIVEHMTNELTALAPLTRDQGGCSGSRVPRQKHHRCHADLFRCLKYCSSHVFPDGNIIFCRSERFLLRESVIPS